MATARQNENRKEAKRAKVRWYTPFLFVLHSLAIVGPVLLAAGFAHRVEDAAYRTFAFAVPAPENSYVTWNSEVSEFGTKVSQAFGVRPSTATEFAGWILEASTRQELEPELLASLVLTESSFRKNVRSHVGAIGPAQVRPEYWRSAALPTSTTPRRTSTVVPRCFPICGTAAVTKGARCMPTTLASTPRGTRPDTATSPRSTTIASSSSTCLFDLTPLA